MSKNTTSKRGRKRSPKGSGRLFKKIGGKQYPADSPVSGSYYLTYTVNGKRITAALRSPDGSPITDKAQAEGERKRILAPFRAGDEVETLQAVQARLEAAKTRQAEVVARAEPPPSLPNIWGSFLESPARPDSSASTLKQYATEWRRFVRWLGDVHPDVEHLHEVTPTMAADYAKNLASAKLSASTYNQHRNLLRMVWRVLADECRLTENPWDRIAPRKLTPLSNRKHAVTPAQFESLLAAVEGDPDLKDLFVLLAWTGLRLADGTLMTWSAVDFSRKVITLAPLKTARRQGKIIHIPMFPAVLKILNERQNGHVINPKRYVFQELAAQYKRDRSQLTNRITAAFEKAGMQPSERRADRKKAVVVYGAHSLRHFFTTAAAAAGMPAAMIKSITGHATDEMLEHYQHISEDLASDIATRIQGMPTVVLPDRDPLPPWAREMLEDMTSKNWKDVRAAILSNGGKALPERAACTDTAQ